MALHDQDVIFNKPSLKELIRLIKNGTIQAIWPSTPEEFAAWNGGGYTKYPKGQPLKSLKTAMTVYYGDNDSVSHYVCIAVGSNIQFKNEVGYPEGTPRTSALEDASEETKKSIDGSITIQVDEEYHYPLINNMANIIDENTRNSQILTVGGLASLFGGEGGLTNRNVGTTYIPMYISQGKFITCAGVVSGNYQRETKGGITYWDVIHPEAGGSVGLQAAKVFGAVFNDYAEYRSAEAKPGRCIIEKGDGTLIQSTKRLQLGANIVSDTFGFAIGETEEAKCPVAVCGRVLAYPLESKDLYTPGAAVCSGPDGTISLMTREEIREWPDAIIGYVSEVPTYDTWGSDNTPINGRIWIKIK